MGKYSRCQLFYRRDNNEWDSVPLAYDPIGGTKRVEDHDRWVSEFTLPNLVNMNGTFFHQMETMKNDFLFMAINLFRYWIQLPINLY